MNKNQKRFWAVLGGIAGITITSIISPIAGLIIFSCISMGAATGMVVWVLREIYKDLAD